MTTGQDMPHDPAPLTAEERALAQRLAQLGAQGEPSPALDARILAAAHAAAASPPARSSRRRMRLPMAFGVAASLALAVGVAWRLRPLPETTVQYESEAASASATAPAQGGASAAAADSAPIVAADATQSSRTQTTVVDPAADAAPSPVAAHEQKRSAPAQAAPEAFPQAAPAARTPPQPSPAPPRPQEPLIVFDQAAPIDAPAPPPAPPAPARPAAEAATQAEAAAQRARQSRAEYESKSMTVHPEIVMDVPPATADAPEVRDAWLQRIRELASDGKLDDARASLREFVHRYPDHPLPDDLRALVP